MKASLTVAVLLASIPIAAYGYTDPGTGAFVYQAAIAGLMGLIWTGRRIVRRLFSRQTVKVRH